MTKNIAIMDAAYALLSANKKPGESFSKVILRGFGPKHKRTLSDLIGVLPSLTDAQAESMKKHIKEQKALFTKKALAKWDL